MIDFLGQDVIGVPWWLSGLRGSGPCCNVGLIPSLGLLHATGENPLSPLPGPKDFN